MRIRTYRHGLGDCHLVTFAKPDGTPFHVLIDCGVVDLTLDPKRLMTRVAQNIASEVQRPGEPQATLDLVIATHQHTDHLSGFEQAKAEFDKMIFKRLWFGWTEKKGNPKAERVKQELGKALRAARAACARLGASKSDVVPRIQGLLDFFGKMGVKGEETQAILDYLQAKPNAEITYHEPGTVIALPEVPNVRVYILGPPEKAADLRIRNPRKSKHEGYEEAGLAADAEGFMSALLGPSNSRADELTFPFEQHYHRSKADASKDPFFQNCYGFGKSGGEAWRRIDDSWLEGAERLALALDNYTNNTSLALAFEFIDTGEVLFFPGDAQVGSWLSWQRLTWNIKDAQGATREVKIKNLFEKTVFYKASHHASHNGTLSGLGLDQMTHPDLVAFVPVDKAMSKKKRWDRTLPWQPLLDALHQATRGRLVLTDTTVAPPDPAKLTALSPAERTRFARQVTVESQWMDYVL